MKHSWDVRFTIGIGIMIFLLLASLKGEHFLDEIIGISLKTISYTVLVRFCFVKWVWKWIPFLEKIHGVPKIEGNWNGSYESTWKLDPDVPFAAGPVKVKITQPNIFQIKITQTSGESLSHSYGEEFEKLEDGSIFLNFSYKNVPNADVRERSQINFGSARYLLHRDKKSCKLSGNYWTDRKSTGKVEIKRSSK